MTRSLSSIFKSFTRNSGGFLARLKYERSFYIDTMSSQNILPKNIQVDTKRYYRYMDRIFCPAPINKLNSTESRILCDLRLDMFDDIVDDRFNQKVMKLFIKKMNLSENSNVLDFGCGNGVYTSQIKKSNARTNVFGIDISKKAIENAESRFSEIQWKCVKEHGQLPFEDCYFDYIVSTFVMHFDVNLNLLNELNRVLKKEGVFLFNIYNKKYFSNALKNKLIMSNFQVQILKTHGFSKSHLTFMARKKYK